ncbi:hypothetical protein AVEN_166492-1 [Araneus ventricosus]|uniref:Uncharacterized protein n=1 Tax=Araneus ventricosus TaxID=182803 RepID=A0A4Y2S6P7_ARAVE|nr:hypothetical protein AVEN_166492-1 [Araneus ventricosus]
MQTQADTVIHDNPSDVPAEQSVDVRIENSHVVSFCGNDAFRGTLLITVQDWNSCLETAAQHRGLFWYPRLGWVPHVDNGTQSNSQPNRGYQNRPLGHTTGYDCLGEQPPSLQYEKTLESWQFPDTVLEI